MFSGGIVTVFVSDLDKAVRFYTEALGLKLAFRFGNEWASIKAGDSLVIGLHPGSKDSPAGRKGSITLGLQLTEPIDKAVHLRAGVSKVPTQHRRSERPPTPKNTCPPYFQRHWEVG